MPTLSQSIQLVADDQRASFPDLTDSQAIFQAYSNVSTEDIYEPESTIGQAYIVVLDFLKEITNQGPRLPLELAVRELLHHV
jgi:hypothetical protein